MKDENNQKQTLNNFEKQRLIKYQTIIDLRKAGIKAIFRTIGRTEQVAIDGIWYDINGSFTGEWPLAKVTRNKLLVWHQAPGRYMYFRILAEDMHNLSMMAIAQHAKAGNAGYDKNTDTVFWIGPNHPTKFWDRNVISAQNEWHLLKQYIYLQ
jgi:hypothetical protein